MTISINAFCSYKVKIASACNSKESYIAHIYVWHSKISHTAGNLQTVDEIQEWIYYTLLFTLCETVACIICLHNGTEMLLDFWQY